MDRLPIIIRQAWNRPATYVEETPERPFTIAFGSKRKLDRHMDMGPFGNVPVLKTTGIDKNMLQVATRVGGTFVTKLTSDGVKRYFRRCRPQEFERLQAIDDDIARVEAELRLLRTTRREALADAWRRGHVVTVHELRERAERRLRETGGGDAAMTSTDGRMSLSTLGSRPTTKDRTPRRSYGSYAPMRRLAAGLASSTSTVPAQGTCAAGGSGGV